MNLEGDSEGTRVRVRVQPRASRTELAGAYGDAVRIRLAAPPVDGAANEELIRFIAKRVGVPRSAVSIVSGESGRDKLVRIDGALPDAVRRALLPG
ncbi:MAG TPA: DUF167 family protein [Longimicrobiales bacterium]|nr:DUF167 family protein [Longimicrobiales bacterium]